MARPPKAYYTRGAWRSDFGGIKNRVLVHGPKNADTKLQAEKELIRLREEACLLQQSPGLNTPFVTVVERFLATYVGRRVYADFSNELHWFMGMDLAADPDNPVKRAGNNMASGGRFGLPCKNWPLRRINAEVVEDYLRRRKVAGLKGYHAFVALRTLMNWAVKKKYIPFHDLNQVDRDLRRKGHCKYIPPDAEVALAFQKAEGKLKNVCLLLMTTGVRPNEIVTVTIDEFKPENRQWVLWRHKVVHRTGMPKVVPIAFEDALQVCTTSAGDRPGDQPLFLNCYGEPWTYNALRLQWYRFREKLGLDSRFTLYSFRHWFLTMASESVDNEALVAELAGQSDTRSLNFYKKIRNAPLHAAANQVVADIERVQNSATTSTPVSPEQP